MPTSLFQSPHPVRRRIGSIALILIGCSLYSIAIVLFIIPSQMMMGGVTGISLIINRLIGFPVGILIAIINIPLFLAGFKSMGRDFFIGSLIGMFFSSVLIDVYKALLPAMPEIVSDRLLASVLGGALSGVGLGLVMAAGASTGGTDIVALLLNKKAEGISLGRLILISDIIIVLVGVIILGDYMAALYTGVMMYASAAVLDGVIYGVNIASVVLIITSKPEEITSAVIETLERGVTILPAKGGYTNRDTNVLLCSLGRRQLGLLKRIIRQADPDAFFIVQEAKEVIGLGFKKLV
jgi:uncharacterized membrane-anchored protein YitT (DUF2179 family)